MFKMEFKVDGAAMDNDEYAVADILRAVADQVELYSAAKIRDANGQLIGEWSVTFNYPEPDEDDDTYNSTEHEYDNDSNVTDVLKVKWCDDGQEWIPADQARWDAHRGRYVWKR